MKKNVRLLVCASALLFPSVSWAAIGCTLSNPAQDLKYLFPDMTSYKEDLKSIGRTAPGPKMYKDLSARLGSDLDPIYESIDTPYTIYQIYKGKTKLGVVHGVNVPGKGGVIQVFLSTDPDTAEIRKFFFQRLESPAAKALRDKEFRRQFEGLTLSDFEKQSDRVKNLKSPAVGTKGLPDYEASLRGVRKNLILLDLFGYGGSR